jgi:hypothetical protein
MWSLRTTTQVKCPVRASVDEQISALFRAGNRRFECNGAPLIFGGTRDLQLEQCVSPGGTVGTTSKFGF